MSVPCARCGEEVTNASLHDCKGALARQEGGDHYKTMAIQPVEYIHKNGIGFLAGNVIKYVSRYHAKGGAEDLRKARHYIDLMLDMEGAA